MALKVGELYTTIEIDLVKFGTQLAMAKDMLSSFSTASVAAGGAVSMVAASAAGTSISLRQMLAEVNRISQSVYPTSRWISSVPQTAQRTARILQSVAAGGSRVTHALNASIEQSFRRLISGLQSFGSTLNRYVTMPIVGAFTAATYAAADFERKMLAIEALVGKERANVLKPWIEQIAKEPGIDLSAAYTGITKLLAAGVSEKTAVDTVRAMAKMAAASAATPADTEAAMISIQQMLSAGMVDAQNMKEILRRIPIFSRVLQSAFGTASPEGIRALNLAPEEFLSKIAAAANELKGAVGGLALKMDNLKDAAMQALNKIGTVMQGRLLPVIDRITGYLERFAALPDAIAAKWIAIAGIFAGLGPIVKYIAVPIVKLIQWLRSAFAYVRGVGAAASAAGGAAAGGLVSAAAPWAAVVAGLAAMIAATWNKIKDTASSVWTSLAGHFESLKKHVIDMYNSAKPLLIELGKLGKKIWDLMTSKWAFDLKVILRVIQGVLIAIMWLLERIADLIGFLSRMTSSLVGQKGGLINTLASAGESALASQKKTLEALSTQSKIQQKQILEEELEGIQAILQKRREERLEMERKRKEAIGFITLEDLWRRGMTAGAKVAFAGLPATPGPLRASDIPSGAEFGKLVAEVREEKRLLAEVKNILKERLGNYG